MMKTKVYRAPSMEIVNMGNMEFVSMVSKNSCIAPDGPYNMTGYVPWETAQGCAVPGGDEPMEGPSIS